MTGTGGVLIVFGGLVYVFALLALQIERHPDARAIYNGFALFSAGVFLLGLVVKGFP